MLDLLKATNIVHENLPNGTIQKCIEYRGLFVFQVFRTAPGEEQVDPFYSVDKETGEFKEFSIITDGDISEITSLFEKAKLKPKRGY